MAGDALGSTKFVVQPAQQRAFDIVAEKMRWNYGSLSELELFSQAQAALQVTAPKWTERARKEAATQISRSISRNFDASKCRPAPQESRGQKAKRNDAVLRFATSCESPVSAAVLAQKFGISKTTAYGILKRGGYYREAFGRLADISAPGEQLISLFKSQMPNDGYRLVQLHSITRAIRTGLSDPALVFNEVNSLQQPLQIHMLDAPTLDGVSKWVVVERGRRKKADRLILWGVRQSYRMIRNPRLRKDQRVILNLDDAPSPKHPILRDIAAVIHISLGSESLNSWRRFLEASNVIDGDVGYISLVDPEALITALNGAIRRNSLDDLIPQMSGWLSNSKDRKAASKLLSIADKLRTAQFSHPLELFDIWSAETLYRQRVEQGLLPFRTVHDLDNISLYRGFENADELLKEFRRSPSDRIWLSSFDDDFDAQYDSTAYDC